MKKFLVTAGGTATAWHIAQIAREYFKEKIEIHVCDTNPPYLVPAGRIAAKVHTVPLVTDPKYTEAIGRIIEQEKIDCIIPLIPQEAFLFSKDNPFILKKGITSSAPSLKTTDLLADKERLYHTLKAIAVPTPTVFCTKEVEPDKVYLLKPRLGFGSVGISVVKGRDIDSGIKDYVIQEYCHSDDYDEVTVEVYNGREGLHIFSRRRIATKAGVCVKMEPVENELFLPYVQELVRAVDCPLAFNVQFLKDKGVWRLYDCNLRLGAGTAMSSAIGFQLTRALLAEMSEDSVDISWFETDKRIKYVLRVYQEVVVK